MNIKVTKHAIKRYRERLFDFTSSDTRVELILIEIARRGITIQSRPSTRDSVYEVRYRDISIVLSNEGNKFVVITCLGETRYRKWIKTQTSFKIMGRVLHPQYSLGLSKVNKIPPLLI